MAQSATSLGPKPSLFLFVFCVLFFAFLSSLSIENPVLPLKRAFLFICCVSLCFSLAFLWPPPFFHFLFLCLSLVCLFFLPSCFSCQFLVLAFCFALFASSFKMLFCFAVLILSCFVLNHNLRYVSDLHFFLLLLLLLFVLLVVVFGCLSKTPLKHWILQKRHDEKCRNTDLFSRAITTSVLTNSVYFFIFVFL